MEANTKSKSKKSRNVKDKKKTKKPFLAFIVTDLRRSHPLSCVVASQKGAGNRGG